MEFIDFKAEEMDEEEKKRFIEDLKKDCICHACPTYNTCTQKSKELLYCILGSSDCPIHERKCLCPQDCPVYQKYGFKGSFYCSQDKDIKRSKVVYRKEVLRV